ncbi:MAG TPA: MOSC domain-containing protein [Synergistales bacterium]|nr:MOSC domain-containing protein [Synergistales bacterium]HQO83792.1 MOSC domain-containing protein [Synergistales bacterium]
MPKVIAVCAGKDRQKPKTELEAALFVKGKGIYGDGHFGMGERQVSLLRSEDISQAENSAGFPFPPGSLAENLVIAGLPEDLSPGQTIRIGESVILIVVEKGKKPGEPHSYDYRGWCLLPEKGYFLRVEKGGRVKPEDAAILV